MTETPRFARLPVLPSWENLLARLYVLPDAVVDRKALRLELIGLASNESVSLNQLFSRLCVFLPKITDCEGVVIWRRNKDGGEVIASNLSPKKSQSLISSRSVLRLAKDRHHFFNRRSPLALQINKKVISYYHLFSVGVLNQENHFLLSLSSKPVASETARVFEVIKQILSLRLKNDGLSQNLSQQETKLANLTQQLGEGMAVLDQGLRIVLWNRALQNLTGFKAGDVLGKPFDQILPRSSQADWLTNLVAQSKTKAAAHLSADFEVTTKEGENRWVSCLVSAYKNNVGAIEQIVIVARDVSHAKNLEKQKNEFISIATHELRTPLTAVRGYLNLLERNNNNLTDKQRSYLAQAIKASDRLAGLAEDLLKVVQIEQDRIQFKPESVHIWPLIKKIVRDFKPRASAKGLTLSLSRPTGSDLLRLDPERIEQVFANLIDNALKYTDQGSVKIFFEEVAARNSQQRSLVINVRDTGIGIGLKNTEEVFRKFHRVHRPEQSKEQGAGLGLYIVKSFVEKQGGTITVKSRVGKGTHFAVTFPFEITSQRSKR